MSIFTKIMAPPVKESTFDLSHDIKTSFKMGQLIPTTVLDVVPGDRFKISVENMLRFTPLVAPVMHKINVKTNYFFVPNRLLWPGWEDFITGESTDPPPTINDLSLIMPNSLGDYLGLPTDVVTSGSTTANALPIAAYYKIWDDYYRDQNLQTEKFTDLVTGNNTAYLTNAIAIPLIRAWEHDYFTSCLPFAQKGTAVTLPLTSTSTIDVEVIPGDGQGILTEAVSPYAALANLNPVRTDSGGSPSADGIAAGRYDPNGTLTVDINAEAVEINDLRTAFSVQVWLEKNARAGSRYIELIKSHFNVKSSDARLNRPEYIGGDSQNMIISEVLATAQTENATNPEVPIGEMAGHGISVGGGKTFSYKAEEHGWIIGLICVIPKTAYQQGLAKMWHRPTYQDYLWPSFANLGEQAVLNQEVMLDIAGASRLLTFGYIPRFAEYRFMNSRVSGLMRDDLSFWTLARIFTALPVLNASFVECVPDDRIFTTIGEDSTDHVIAHIFNNIHATRKLPKYAVPSGL